MAKHVTMNISMPKLLREYVDSRIEDGGFGNVSEYFRYLVRAERQRVDERIESLAAEGLRSKRRIVADADYWNRKRATLGRELAKADRPRRKAG